ncbi:Sialate O-acetylesterase [Seminavis robusta]|uniref:Sialate O-acetylesterase n=1 Tax=Seminavis robusta TaxID=568900 RepID=A0A9N8DER4_9STRA|nr:Sialate O-acetylesterase [Seminavis robusta]|eukprot:Sro55_g032180.1 Sialate O-acetylesterase (564) ;mRNA; r:27700-29391
MRVVCLCLLSVHVGCILSALAAEESRTNTSANGSIHSIPGERIWQTDNEPVPPISSGNTESAEDVTRNFVSATLGSNMVLQRDREVTLWGYSTKGAIITTTLLLNTEESAAPPIVPVVLSTTATGDDGLWRQALPPQAASLEATSIKIKSSTGQSQTLENVLFGDVYICGGQSNMVFSIPGATNGTTEANKGNRYPHIRVFTVGQKTASKTPLPDLQTVEQPWSVANNHSLYTNVFYVNGGGYSHFSAVCFFFGRQVADGLGNKIPIGLISNNWGGTKIQRWQPQNNNGGDLYNSMIHPYMVGPMAITGFTWYQGEANAGGSSKAADEYSHLFPQLIQAWRDGFQVPNAYFGFVQLSTWCPPAQPQSVAELRQAQMAAMRLKNVGYSTNADMGFGCNIHPPKKQYCGRRLGNSALAIQYGQPIHWKSPSYCKVTTISELDLLVESRKENSNDGRLSVVVHFQDVSSDGLYMLETSYNAQVKGFTCQGKPAGTCAGAAVLLNGQGWVNAAISITGNDSVTLTAPAGYSTKDSIIATSYGWGSVPLMTLYDKGTDLPVLPWKEKI